MSKPNGDRERGNRGGPRNNNGNHNNGSRGNREGNKDRKDGGHKKELYRGEERPKKDAILDLSLYLDQEIRVKFNGGREISGILKGYDQLMNLVLDGVKERLRDPDDENVLLDQTRDLGKVVVRGPLLQSIYPSNGAEVIANPFAPPPDQEQPVI